ncbi:apolipoprotein C-I-like [Boleophthalmus pectinirostris]|uniref:apolipoprotein C-I-like n=1 Tax=Boleophthalmus pectinirostris TaxID=150288 RepID=UPI00242FEE7E|nr:apolipoprotein C-I-like [Boleophthalmus pectinirostris]
MKLYLALAVLVLAFVAYTEAQDDTAEDGFNRVHQSVTEFGKTALERAQAALNDFNNNEKVQKAKTWFQEQIEKIKNRFNN